MVKNMYKTVSKPVIKQLFSSDLSMMTQVVVATLAFIFNCVPLTIIFFSFYLSLLLLLSDDITPAILPVCLLSMSLTGQYGSKPEDYFPYIPCVVVLIICAVLHFVFYPPVFRRGKMLFPSIAVAAALMTGGLFTISAKDYFAPVTLYYTLTLGVGMTAACLIIYSYTRPSVPLKVQLSSQMSYFTLAAVLILFSMILPFIAKGKFNWYFSWKNTLTTFLLLSAPFPFYVAAKEGFGIKAWAHFLLGCTGYGAAILSFSRGGMLFGGIALCVCVVACCILCEKRNRIVYITVAVLGSTAAIALAFSSGLIKSLLSEMHVSSNETRVKLWKEAVSNFLKNPIFGAGVGFRGQYFNPQTGNMYWYHSTPFQIIGTAGLIGVAAYGYMYIVKLKIVFSDKTLFNVFFAVAFLGFEAYQLVDAGNFVPIPFVLLVTHMFIIAESVSGSPSEEERIPSLKEKKIENPQLR